MIFQRIFKSESNLTANVHQTNCKVAKHKYILRSTRCTLINRVAIITGVLKHEEAGTSTTGITNVITGIENVHQAKMIIKRPKKEKSTRRKKMKRMEQT